MRARQDAQRACDSARSVRTLFMRQACDSALCCVLFGLLCMDTVHGHYSKKKEKKERKEYKNDPRDLGRYNMRINVGVV